MNNLIRTRVDNFSIENSYTLEDLENINLITIEEVFNEYPRIDLSSKKLELFLNGVKLSIDREDNLYRVYSSNNFIGLGIVKDNLLKRDIVVIDN